MNGLISGIKRMEIHDGDGIRTTIFFKGCPLRCIWCHNPESISFERKIAFYENKCTRCGICKEIRSEATAELCPNDAIVVYGKEYDVDALVDEVMQDEPFFKTSGGGVTFSGGECLAQPEFAIELAKKFCEKGISVFVDTCGYVRQDVFKKIISYVDKFLYDIKAIDSETHKKCTGKDNKIILENLQFLSENNCNIEIRYPLVKGYNDKECEKIADFLKGLQGVEKVKVLQYHNFSASRYEALKMENTLPNTMTSYSDVETAVNLLKKYGLNAINGMVEN